MAIIAIDDIIVVAKMLPNSSVMASIRQKSTSPYWFACFTDHTGRRRQVSTKVQHSPTKLDRENGLTKRKLSEKAKAVAEDLERIAREGISERQIRKVLAKLYEERKGQTLEQPTIEEYLESWLDRQRLSLAPASASRYRDEVKRFLSFLGEDKGKKLETLEASQIEAFRDNCANSLALRTANFGLKVLRMAMKSAVEKGLLFEDPARPVKAFTKKQITRNSKTIRKKFDIPEIRLILKHANVEWRGLILFGLYSAQRLGDLARLRWSHLHIEEGYVTIATSKKQDRRDVPLSSPLLDYMTSLDPPDENEAPLFPKSFERLNASGKVGTLSNQFRSILATAGLIEPVSHEKKKSGQGRNGRRTTSTYSFHSLRHSAVSMLKAAGVSDAIVRDIVGHDSELVSREYTHLSTDDKKPYLARLPDITKEENSTVNCCDKEKKGDK